MGTYSYREKITVPTILSPKARIEPMGTGEPLLFGPGIQSCSEICVWRQYVGGPERKSRMLTGGNRKVMGHSGASIDLPMVRVFGHQ
jgi:hypothetical protein